MLSTRRRRKIVGVTLIVIGVLFLLVANNILFGWGDVWPLFSVIAGIVFLRMYASTRSPEMLFAGITSFFTGVFLFFFSMGALPWSQMAEMWPFIPLIAGVALLAVTVTQRHATGSLVAGVGILLFAVLGFLYNTGVIDERVAAPFLRFWPLVLVLAGIILVKAAGGEQAEDPDMKAVRGVLTDQPDQEQAASEPVYDEKPPE